MRSRMNNMWYRRDRDSQKQKVYDAEDLCRNRLRKEFSDEYRLLYESISLDEIEKYCKKIIDSAWFQKRWPQIKGIHISDGRSRRSASGGRVGKNARMKFPIHARYKEIVLHELAHACDMSHAGWHGRPFCRIFLELLRHEFGDEVWKIMKECFKEKKVKVRVEVRRPDLLGKMSPGFDKMIAAKKKNIESEK